MTSLNDTSSLNLNNARQLLVDTPLNEYFSSQEIDTLISFSSIEIFEPGASILKQGQKSPGVYIILQGSVTVSAKILGAGQVSLATIHRGGFLGEISLIEKGPCSTSVIAKTQVICLLLNNLYFEVLSLLFPETRYKLLLAITNEVCARVQHTHQKIIEQMHTTDMTTQSLFSEVIKSLTHTKDISYDEAELNIEDLYQNAIFNNLSEEEYRLLLSHAKLIKAPKQCTIISQNESEQRCYIVLRGAVQSSIIEDNKVAKLAVLGPMSFFCNIGCNANSFINYTTCDRAILFEFNEAAIQAIESENELLWYKLFDLVCEAYVALERVIDKLDIRLNGELYNR